MKNGFGTVECIGQPGQWLPVVSRESCSACGACAEHCPSSVFEIRTLDENERAALPFVARVRLIVQRNRVADPVHAEECRGCNRCLRVCPDDAIRLVWGILSKQ